MSHVSTTVKLGFILGVQQVAAKLGSVVPEQIDPHHRAFLQDAAAHEIPPPEDYISVGRAGLGTLGGITGTVIGGTAGALGSLPGHRMRGGLYGALGGAAVGGLAGYGGGEGLGLEWHQKDTDLVREARNRLENAAKLGTVEPIEHKSRSQREPFDFAADKKDELWREMDRETATTGEESGIGMPSAGGVDKNAGLSDGGYGDTEGPYAQGSFDANQHLVDRDKRLRSAIEEAFLSNENYDKSYGPESATTQPKLANTAFGIGGGLRPASLAPRNTAPRTTLPKPPQAPQVPKMTNVTDPRSDKPKGMNLQHSVQTNAYSSNGMESMSSPSMRFQGSPV